MSWKSFLEGFASIFDIWPQPPRYKPMTTQEAMEADAEALRKDMEQVGKDLQNALKGKDSK